MICPSCGRDNHQLADFCSRCGHALSGRKIIDSENTSQKNLTMASIYFVVLLSFLVIANFVPLDNFSYYITSEIIFAVIVLVFLLLDLKKTASLFRFPDKPLKIIGAIILLSPLLAYLVILFSDFLNQSMFDHTQSDYYEQFSDTSFPLIISLLFIGVFPALFEEIAFRGTMFNLIHQYAGKSPTIIITSIMFTMLHFSIFAVLWIFPLGMLFGYLRSKYNTIWYGMIAHFMYNSSIVVFDYIQ